MSEREQIIREENCPYSRINTGQAGNAEEQRN